MYLLRVLRDSCSENVRAKIENLISFTLTTRYCSELSELLELNPPAFLLRIRVFGSATLVECLNSFFDVIFDDSGWHEIDTYTYPYQQFISSSPRFLFINLGRDMWNIDLFQKDCRHISFQILLDVTVYALGQGVHGHINWLL
jgi:hypothetical protein